VGPSTRTSWLIAITHFILGSSAGTSAKQTGHTCRANVGYSCELKKQGVEMGSRIADTDCSFFHMADLVDAKPSCHAAGMVNMLAGECHLQIPSPVLHLADYTPVTHRQVPIVIFPFYLTVNTNLL
jgi:hypothetical protein